MAKHNNRMCALHVGVSRVDETHYQHAFKPLQCCQADARLFQQVTSILGYDQEWSKTMLNKEATAENFKAALLAYADLMEAGDFLLLTYSGHGGSIKNLLPGSGKDETWVLYDRQLFDKELPEIWARFKPGVRIVTVIDSCHSGGAIRILANGTKRMTKNIPNRAKSNIFGAEENRELYLNIRRKYQNPPTEFAADILQLAACEDYQLAIAGWQLSQYTQLFVASLTEEPLKNYPALQDALIKVHNSRNEIHTSQEDMQTPVYKSQGQPTTFFEQNSPFTRNGEALSSQERSAIAAALEEVLMTIPGMGKDEHIELLVDSKVVKGTTRGIALKGKSNKGFEAVRSTGAIEGGNAWDAAYHHLLKLTAEGNPTFVEPAFKEVSVTESAGSPAVKSRGLPKEETWPAPPSGGPYHAFSWHLHDDFTQLASAHAAVINHFEGAPPSIRIGHIDTGVRYEHRAIDGANISREEAKSFLRGEESNPAIDELASERTSGAGSIGERFQRLAEQDFHGTATLALLAGGHVDPPLAYDGFSGTVGAIPFAEIIPMRISETVALTGLLGNTKEFVEAVNYAIDIGCRVITMSMAGSPSRAWAKVVNRAYENGVIIVSAAGNSFPRGLGKLSPTKVLYPARFERVIAATGVSFNNQPYVAKLNDHEPDGYKSMQGNYGPRRAMKTALAAYTPNVPWARFNEDGDPIIKRTGAGTSSATPQVAAAAALYFTRYAEDMRRLYGEKPNWQWAEATRQALFRAADDTTYAESTKHFGRGTLKAFTALEQHPLSVEELAKHQAPKARVFTGATSFLKILLRKGIQETEVATPDSAAALEMICLEAQQILHQDEELVHLAADLEFDAGEMDEADEKRMIEALKAAKYSPLASQFFQEMVAVG